MASCHGSCGSWWHATPWGSQFPATAGRVAACAYLDDVRAARLSCREIKDAVDAATATIQVRRACFLFTA